MQHLKLIDGHQMPILGLGTWMINGDALSSTVEAALELGYRHFDTASNYGNEKALGDALNKWLVTGKGKREDLFVTSKLPPLGMYADKAMQYLIKSLNDLNIKYIDLYLLHCPLGLQESQLKLKKEEMQMDEAVDHVAVWRVLEKQVRSGLVRSLGVSNFTTDQIEHLYDTVQMKPAVNQVELHLLKQQFEMVQYCKDRDINVIAYSPLASPGIKKYHGCDDSNCSTRVPDLLQYPEIQEFAKEYKKTPAQILLRYTIQRGICVIPKAVKSSFLEENLAIFDFSFTPDQMTTLADLDKNLSILHWEPWTWV